MLKRSELILAGLLGLSLFVLPGCQGTAKEEPSWLTGRSSVESSIGSSQIDIPTWALKQKFPAYGQRK